MSIAATSITVIFLLLSPVVVTNGAPIETYEANKLQGWRESLGLGTEKVTRLHFFFHDIISGGNPTAVQIAEANQTRQSPSGFGLLMMVDDPLTEGPDINSKLIGRAQGLYGSSAKNITDIGLFMAMDFGFTEGRYNGSSLTISGRNRVLNSVREIPVVGGSGVFKFARGIAVARTYWSNNLGDAIVEYNITVVHY